MPTGDPKPPKRRRRAVAASGAEQTAGVHPLRSVRLARSRIGFGFTINGHRPCVLSCIVPGSPAEAANLRPGDYLVGVNGRPADRMAHDQVAALIAGSGDSLLLQIVPAQPSSAGSCSDSASSGGSSGSSSALHLPAPPPPVAPRLRVHQPRRLPLGLSPPGAIGPEDLYESLLCKCVVANVGSVRDTDEAAAAAASDEDRPRRQLTSAIGSLRRRLDSRTEPQVLEIRQGGVTARGGSGRPAWQAAACDVAFAASCQEDARFFGLVVGSVARVYCVYSQLYNHADHRQLADAFRLACSPDGAGGCVEFPDSSAPVVHQLVRLYRLSRPTAPTSLSFPTPRPQHHQHHQHYQHQQLQQPNDSANTTATLTAANSTVGASRVEPAACGLEQLPRCQLTTHLEAKVGEESESVTSSCCSDSEPPAGARRLLSQSVHLGSPRQPQAHQQLSASVSERNLNQRLCAAPSKTSPLGTAAAAAAALSTSAAASTSAYDAAGGAEAANSVAKWATGLEYLLADSDGLAAFTEFLKLEFSEENVAFWLAVEKFRSVTDERERRMQAGRILSDFIGINAPHCVNLDSVTAESVRSAVLADSSSPPPLSPSTFDAAQRHIFDLMRLDSYRRFLKSDVYKDCLLCQLQSRPLPFRAGRVGSVNCVGGEAAGVHRAASETDAAGEKKAKGFFTALIRNRQSKRFQKSVPADSCRFHLSDGSSATVSCSADSSASGQSLRSILFGLCDKRGLNLAASEVFVTGGGADESLDLDAPLSRFAGRVVSVERRVLFRLELPSARCVGVRAKPTKSLRDVLRPVCARYSLKLDQLVLCRDSTFVPVQLDSAVQGVDNARLAAIWKDDFVDFHLSGDCANLGDNCGYSAAVRRRHRHQHQHQHRHQHRHQQAYRSRASIGSVVQMLKNSFN